MNIFYLISGSDAEYERSELVMMHAQTCHISHLNVPVQLHIRTSLHTSGRKRTVYRTVYRTIFGSFAQKSYGTLRWEMWQ
eukprot:1189704-Prorocentrum_minimum.AAC.1